MKRNKEEILKDTMGGGGRGWRGSTYNVRHSKLLRSKLCSNTGYSERCLYSLFPYPLKLSIRYKGKRRLQICKDPSTVLPICTFPGFIGGCSPVKQWHKTKHRETRDPGNRGHTPELGEGQTGWGRGSCAKGCGRGQVQTGVRGRRRAIGRSQDKKQKLQQQKPN